VDPTGQPAELNSFDQYPPPSPFTNIQEGVYWSSTTATAGGDYKLRMWLPNSFIGLDDKSRSDVWVWPVRDA
jgi:hypothetical protein